MRVVIAATAALFLAAGAAAAQAPSQSDSSAPAAQLPASRCPAFPPEPTLPDGATARNRAEMNRGNEAYQAWGQQMQAVLACRRTEAEELRVAAQAALAHAEARVGEFNSAVARLTAVGTAWQAEAAEFNARGGRR
jgi:hypothetical protein